MYTCAVSWGTTQHNRLYTITYNIFDIRSDLVSSTLYDAQCCAVIYILQLLMVLKWCCLYFKCSDTVSNQFYGDSSFNRTIYLSLNFNGNDRCRLTKLMVNLIFDYSNFFRDRLSIFKIVMKCTLELYSDNYFFLEFGVWNGETHAVFDNDSKYYVKEVSLKWTKLPSNVG